VLSKIDPDPGFGMVTLRVVAEDEDAPNALVVPIGSIKRIELREAPEEQVQFGFSLPPPG
jgi:hypothetical protein